MDAIAKNLEDEYTLPIRDPVWKHIYLSPALMDIIAHEAFQNLNRIKQLGPTYLVYPGATHTRFSHSLGVFHIAYRMIRQLVKRKPSFTLSPEGVRAFLCAALLHDLGHYPFAHSLKDLEVKTHESLTADIILESGLSKKISRTLHTDPLLVAAIIDRELEYGGDGDVTFYRNLLSGVLDPDKLDYLNRDAYYCGIPYGQQDVDHILSDIHPVPQKGIAITGRGLTSVESILFAKYIMYKTVYWHKTVRIATSMIKKAVLMGLNDRIITADDLYGLNDQTFFTMADTTGFRPFRLLSDVLSRRLYKQVYISEISSGHSAYRRLENLTERLAAETRIAREIGKISGHPTGTEDIVIDIPEHITFEIDVPLLHNNGDGNITFRESGSVFSDTVVGTIAGTLRFVTVSVARREEILESIHKIDIAALLAG
ncbi:MAG: HD domain-containing protein [Spirochaetales bacterium]|nr:HD domain-containing protein [Spirochaetales bacterium]